MTEIQEEGRQKEKRTGHAASVLSALFLLLLILFLAQSQRLSDWMREALSLCAHVLIPSLFPFLILSDLVLKSGAAEGAGRLLARPMRRLFGLSGVSASAVLMGMLCGFPIGARMAIALYEKGRIPQGEAERLLAVCSIPSPAFLIGSVGISLLGSQRDGLLLYAVNLCSALFLCFLSHLAEKKHPAAPVRIEVNREPAPFGIPQITRAIGDSVSSMLHICAFVLAFSCVIHLAGLFLELLPFAVPPLVRAVLFGFFELTGGMTDAAALPTALRLPACAMISGWSGLSVHAQIVSLAGDRPLSFRPYLLTKALSAALNTLLLWVVRVS